MNVLKFILIISFLKVNLLSNNNSINISGYVDFNYIARLSDQSLINLPYRLLSLNIIKQNNNISFLSTISIEHSMRRNTDYLSNTSPTDFEIDMRELYLQYFTDWGEIRLGKSIHTWGNTDENSPVDVVSPLDYYYLFSSGIEKKLATFSLSTDIYINNLKLNIIISPLHNTNRIPSEEDDFPISLPVNPKAEEIRPLEGKPYEYGLDVTSSYNFGQISLSFFSGYDRLFNLTGVNVFGRGPSLSQTNIDILYGYRKTNMIGIGGTLITDGIILRSDLAYFNTIDENKSIQQQSLNTPTFYDSLHYSYPLEEKTNYFQLNAQIEFRLPFDIKLVGQYFHYDTLDYMADTLPIDQDISLPNLELESDDINPKNFFNPGLGSSLSILTKKASLITLRKSFFNKQLELQLSTLFDIDNSNYKKTIPGSLNSLQFKYIFDNSLDFIFSITKIVGNKNHPDGKNYKFKLMEDFSHIKIETKYSF